MKTLLLTPISMIRRHKTMELIYTKSSISTIIFWKSLKVPPTENRDSMMAMRSSLFLMNELENPKPAWGAANQLLVLFRLLQLRSIGSLKVTISHLKVMNFHKKLFKCEFPLRTTFCSQDECLYPSSVRVAKARPWCPFRYQNLSSYNKNHPKLISPSISPSTFAELVLRKRSWGVQLVWTLMVSKINVDIR